MVQTLGGQRGRAFAEKSKHHDQPVLGDQRHVTQGREVLLRGEPELGRPLAKNRLVRRLQEELAHEHVGHMLSSNHDWRGRIGEAVLAGIQREALALAQAVGQHRVAFHAPATRLRVLAMEVRANPLPAGTDQHGSLQVDYRRGHTDGFAESA